MVDEPTIDQLNPSLDVTGSVVQLSLADEIVLARALITDLKRVALVGDAWERQTAYRHWKDEIASATAGLEVINLIGLKMRELQKRVAQLPDRTAIVYSAIYSDGEGNFFTPADALALVAKTANRPIIAAAETFVGRGAVGGYLMLPAVIGEQAAESALRILDGHDVSQVSGPARSAVQAVFDWRQMQRWGISETSLPAGAEGPISRPERMGAISMAISGSGLRRTTSRRIDFLVALRASTPQSCGGSISSVHG